MGRITIKKTDDGGFEVTEESKEPTTAHWIEGKYNSYYYRIPLGQYGHIQGILSWLSEGYVVKFNGVTLKKRYPDLEQAKAAMENLVRNYSTALHFSIGLCT